MVQDQPAAPATAPDEPAAPVESEDTRRKRLEFRNWARAAIATEAARRRISATKLLTEHTRVSRGTVVRWRKGDWSEGPPSETKVRQLCADLGLDFNDPGLIMGWVSIVEVPAAPTGEAIDDGISGPELARRPNLRRLLAILADDVIPEPLKARLDRRIGFMLAEEEAFAPEHAPQQSTRDDRAV